MRKEEREKVSLRPATLYSACFEDGSPHKHDFCAQVREDDEETGEPRAETGERWPAGAEAAGRS